MGLDKDREGGSVAGGGRLVSISLLRSYYGSGGMSWNLNSNQGVTGWDCGGVEGRPQPGCVRGEMLMSERGNVLSTRLTSIALVET